MKGALLRLVRPSTGVETFVATLLWWNPVVAAVITFMLSGTSHFVRSWIVSLSIAELVVLQCFTVVFALTQLDRAWARARGREPPRRSRGATMMLSLVVLPFALPLAFRGGQALAPLLGIEATPSARAYRIGIGFGVVAVALAFFQLARNESRAAATKAEARVRALENARLRAELAALTAEMNPHLLFNALNTIAALVHDEPDRAEEVVMYLAELYRGSLGSARRSSHALADELRLCDAYLKVERARFGERLRVEMDVAGVDTAAIRVPVLILQPFVENAVKHGVATRAKGGTVKVSAAVAQGRVSLTVEDDGPGFGASSHRGAGRAVDNCRERLSLMYREGAELSLEGRTPAGTPGARVVLRMPIDLPDVPEEAKS